MYRSDAKLIRNVLEGNGFAHTENHNWHILWSTGYYRNNVNDGRVNHFPNSIEVTKKDRLCKNVVEMQRKFGKEFEIIPDTYILPDEFADFYTHFHELKQKEDEIEEVIVQNKEDIDNSNFCIKTNKNAWIVKPMDGCQGKGIYITDDITKVPIDEQCVVSRYITNPLLLRGLKFDLRLYVLVTSFEPLRIYFFNEGLVRFASEKYTDGDFDNKFIHLTNYSINKKNEKFVQSNNYNEEESNKWSFALLSKHLEAIGVNMNLLWSRVYDIIIKTFIS